MFNAKESSLFDPDRKLTQFDQVGFLSRDAVLNPARRLVLILFHFIEVVRQWIKVDRLVMLDQLSIRSFA